jgi:hypothetical protein
VEVFPLKTGEKQSRRTHCSVSLAAHGRSVIFINRGERNANALGLLVSSLAHGLTFHIENHVLAEIQTTHTGLDLRKIANEQ